MTTTEQAIMDEMKALIRDLQVKVTELEIQNNVKRFHLEELISQLEQTRNKEYDL